MRIHEIYRDRRKIVPEEAFGQLSQPDRLDALTELVLFEVNRGRPDSEILTFAAELARCANPPITDFFLIAMLDRERLRHSATAWSALGFYLASLWHGEHAVPPDPYLLQGLVDALTRDPIQGYIPEAPLLAVAVVYGSIHDAGIRSKIQESCRLIERRGIRLMPRAAGALGSMV